MMEQPKHPGKIVFIDGATNKITDEQDAAEVPFTIRFAETTTGLVPVVKIVSFETENQRFIRLYGPDDEFLQAITMIAD